uniref:Putative biotin--protein ligase n=1 Tax=Panstrongylus megistus TaxID=65343 RepID=A0A069DXC6_9HEMI
MLTVYYVAATWLQSWRLSSILQKIRQVSLRNGSIVIHQELPPYIHAPGTVQQKMEVSSVLSDLCINHKEGHIGDLFWYTGNKRIVSIYPKQQLDISGWIKVIPGRTHLPLQIKGNESERFLTEKSFYILVEANYNTCQYNFLPNVLELENFGEPIAWHVGDRISILLRTDDVTLSHLSVTFLQNNLTLENGIEIMRIQSVDIIGSPYKIYNISTVPQTYAPLDPRLNRNERKDFFMSRWRAHVSMLSTFCEAIDQVKDTLQDISVRHPGSGVGAVKLIPSNYINEDESTPVYTPTENEFLEKCNSVPSNVCVVESPSISSTQLSSQISTDMSTAQGSTRLAADSATTSLSSLRSLPPTPRRTISTDIGFDRIKPPNIIIFSDSASAADSVKVALESTLLKDRYTIHMLNFAGMLSTPWLHQACLVVIHGNVPPTFTPVIIDYLLQTSGSLLVLCSDFLGSILPMFHTAEVRPNELVQCSYKSWKHVPLMHHVFCYQPTPMAPQFSHDEHSSSLRAIPESVEIKDLQGQMHKLKIDILGAEETWQTPSLLLVSLINSTSKIVFSQVHLEVAPSQYESDDKKRQALEKSDKARLEILCDVLGSHLGLQCSIKQSPITFVNAYFLGNHEAKQELLDKLLKEGILDSNNVMKAGNLNLKFCGKGVSPPTPSANLLPVLQHSCPHSFSTVDYFENLNTESIGRLVIFSEVITSSMQVIENLELCHGFTVIPLYQTKGKGRGGNTWLSPKGCAMFSMQLHLPLNSYLGKYPSMLQHITSLAIVSSICQISGLEELDIGIKWPNDIYVNKRTKLGGVLVSSILSNDTVICNIGCGLNLYNKDPTVCINDLINSINNETGAKLSELSYEIYFANVFNKLEELYKMAQSDFIDDVKSLYYSFWLHSDAEVEVKLADHNIKKVKVKGIDSYGFLSVETPDGNELTLQPDGNTFDMLSNLIISK